MSNSINNIEDILNSEFFESNVLSNNEIEADNKHLEQLGWTKEDIEGIASIVSKIETIEALEMNQKATIVVFKEIPNIEQQNKLFDIDNSIVLEF